MLMIDANKWEEFYKKMTDGLKPYDHYDDGYRDAMDNVDDWMDGNQVKADPVRHGRWLPQVVLGEKAWDCSECKTLGSPHWKWCPVCGAKMDLEGE